VQLEGDRRSALGGPEVSNLAWAHATRNRTPRILVLEVEPPGVAWSRRNGGAPDRTRPLVADDPVARRVATEVGRRSRPAPIRKAYEPGIRTVRWTAVDPDGDALRFDLELRREGDASWVPLAAGVEDEFHGWDARGAADGVYRVRLTADDGGERSRDARRIARRISAPFVIDNTPPTLRVERVEAGWTVLVEDPGGGPAALERAAGDDDWIRVDPEDGVVDGASETFVVEAESGSRPIRVRATDRAGNVRERVLATNDRDGR
jgi:hypothetical protein